MKKYIDRRTIILTSLVLLLFVVGFTYNSIMNEDYLTSEEAITDSTGVVDPNEIEFVGDAITDPTQIASQPEGVTDQSIGIAPDTSDLDIATNNNAAKSDEKSAFFSEYRLEREKNRSKEKELWEGIINSTTAEVTFKTMAQQELVKMVSLTEKEMIIENLIIAKGFEDALVFLTDDNVTVVVNANELNQQSVAQIQDIIMRKTNISPSNIKIMQKD